MKDKNLIIKVDDEFLGKVDFIEKINGYKNRSDAVRKLVEKEWRKDCVAFPNCQDCRYYKKSDEQTLTKFFEEKDR